jgi:hypothetical protein
MPMLGFKTKAGELLEDFEVLGQWIKKLEAKGWIQYLNIRISKAGVHAE